jgi:zinc protease
MTPPTIAPRTPLRGQSRSAWLLVALVLLAACRRTPAPQTATQPTPEPLDPARLLVQDSQSPVVELRVLFEAGSVDDPVGREGLTYVTVTTMLEGGAAGIDYAERERRLFPMAAEIGGQVEREQVVFTARVHRDHLQAFYPLFRDLLRAPDFAQADFERVRARALSSLTQDLRGADDESLGKELLQQMIYEEHPYGRPELGTERGLSALELGDLRAHWQRVLCARRVRVALSGAVDAGLSNQLAHDFGALGGPRCSDVASTPPAPPSPGRRVWIVDKPEAGSVAMSLGHAIPVTRAHPDYAALTLAAAYLGQHRTFAGRLMQKMRADRGLNYGDYAYAEHFVQDGHTRFPLPNVARKQQYFSVWIRPVQPEQAHFALRMAVRELETFVREGISQPDFGRIQRFVDGYFALFAQTEQQRLGNLLDDAFYGVSGPHLDTLRAAMRALTREQVNAAVKRHLDPSKLQIALVARDAEKLSAALLGGEPSPIAYPAEKPPELLEEDKLIAAHPLNLRAEQLRIVPVGQVFR